MQLAAQNPGWRIINLDARARERYEYAENADLLVVYQSGDADLLPVIEKRRSRGLKTLVEYNDNFYSPPAASPVAASWSSPLIWQMYERFMHESDGIVVTGPGLRDLFGGRFDKPIRILENHLPDRPGSFDTLFARPDGKINIGWAGSIGHAADLMAVLPVLRAVLHKFSNVTLHVMGNESLPDIIGVPPERLKFTHWGSMQDYYNFWKPVHIGIAPLLDIPYNVCRSDIKAVEMAGCGVLPVLTDLLPYREFLARTPAPSFKTFEDLERVLTGYITDPDRIAGDAQRCCDYVVSQRIGPERRERSEFYLKHMPAEPGNFQWPVPEGYHEIQGTPSERTFTWEILKKADELIKSGKAAQAADEMMQAISANRFNADLAVAYAHYFWQADTAGTARVLEDAGRLFPDDLRIKIQSVRVSRTDDAAAGAEAVFARLETAGGEYRDFFYKEVMQRFFPLIKSSPAFREFAERLVKIYSFSAPLRMELAEFYRAAGEHKKALEHVSWLVERYRENNLNGKYLSELPFNYIKSLEESLIAGSRGSMFNTN